MFTGIVEEMGQVVSISKAGDFGSLEIVSPQIQADLKLGDSVATDGVCLTVSQLKAESFVMDVMPISWQITTLDSLQIGDKVNLERALRADGRLGGHFVTGHIDGVGVVQSIAEQGNAKLIEISAKSEMLLQLVMKGSVALAGISLTVHSLTGNSFGVSIIPHTVQHTTLNFISAGQRLNIETDILGKYCQSFLKQKPLENSAITQQFLQNNGFF